MCTGIPPLELVQLPLGWDPVLGEIPQSRKCAGKTSISATVQTHLFLRMGLSTLSQSICQRHNPNPGRMVFEEQDTDPAGLNGKGSLSYGHFGVHPRATENSLPAPESYMVFPDSPIEKASSPTDHSRLHISIACLSVKFDRPASPLQRQAGLVVQELNRTQEPRSCSWLCYRLPG